MSLEEKRQPDGATKLIASNNFIGYETDYHTAHKNQKGVKINFDSAEVRKNDGTQTSRWFRFSLFLKISNTSGFFFFHGSPQTITIRPSSRPPYRKN